MLGTYPTPLGLFSFYPVPRNTRMHTKQTLKNPSLPNSSSIAPLRSLFSSAVEIQSDLSQLQQHLKAFYEHAADAAQSVHSRNEEKDKTNTGGDLIFSLAGLFWRTKDKFSWIDGDTQLLKMHKGDLIDVLTVFGGAYVLPLPPGPSFLVSSFFSFLPLLLLVLPSSPPRQKKNKVAGTH